MSKELKRELERIKKAYPHQIQIHDGDNFHRARVWCVENVYHWRWQVFGKRTDKRIFIFSERDAAIQFKLMGF
jgi:hypothetical protein